MGDTAPSATTCCWYTLHSTPGSNRIGSSIGWVKTTLWSVTYDASNPCAACQAARSSADQPRRPSCDPAGGAGLVLTGGVGWGVGGRGKGRGKQDRPRPAGGPVEGAGGGAAGRGEGEVPPPRTREPPDGEDAHPRDEERAGPLEAQERERVEHVGQRREQRVGGGSHQVRVGRRRAAHGVDQSGQRCEGGQEHERDERERDRVAAQQVHSYNLGYGSDGSYAAPAARVEPCLRGPCLPASPPRRRAARRRGHGRGGLHTAGDGADRADVTRVADIPDLVLGPLAGRPEADWYRAPPGKWTPAQIVHHLAISIDGSGRDRKSVV